MYKSIDFFQLLNVLSLLFVFLMSSVIVRCYVSYSVVTRCNQRNVLILTSLPASCLPWNSVYHKRYRQFREYRGWKALTPTNKEKCSYYERVTVACLYFSRTHSRFQFLPYEGFFLLLSLPVKYFLAGVAATTAGLTFTIFEYENCVFDVMGRLGLKTGKGNKQLVRKRPSSRLIFS